MRVAVEDLDVVKLNELIDKGERFDVCSNSDEDDSDLWERDDDFWSDQ
jgi:hypothetical protein